ncbi:MAG TPA: hypothetical protein VH328_13205, partial [Burkholderiaceae bacterium]|nr:hypothetical protein [Burkholderiaceae bacterium]
ALDIRERTQAPLFSFWHAAHEDAQRQAIDLLGPDEFERLRATGAGARDEGVVLEALALLRKIAAA